MKKISVTALALAALAAATGSAMAGGFNGAYIGGDIGGSGSHIATVYTGVPGTYNLGANGFTGGGFAGYGVTFDKNWYAGLEIGFDASTSRATAPAFSAPLTAVSYPYSGSVGGRLGYAIAPTVLLYGAASFVEGEQVSKSDTVTRDGSLATRTQWNPGARVGGGVEFAVTPNIFTRLSYDVNYNNASIAAFGIHSTEISQTGKLGLGYRF